MKKTFRVTAHGKSLRVVLVDGVHEVQKQWIKLYGKAATGEDEETNAFFLPPSRREEEKQYGTIFIPTRSPFRISFVVHECVHAAVADTQRLGISVTDASAEERIATLTGLLASRILAKTCWLTARRA